MGEINKTPDFIWISPDFHLYELRTKCRGMINCIDLVKSVVLGETNITETGTDSYFNS